MIKNFQTKPLTNFKFSSFFADSDSFNQKKDHIFCLDLPKHNKNYINFLVSQPLDQSYFLVHFVELQNALFFYMYSSVHKQFFIVKPINDQLKTKLSNLFFKSDNNLKNLSISFFSKKLKPCPIKKQKLVSYITKFKKKKLLRYFIKNHLNLNSLPNSNISTNIHNSSTQNYSHLKRKMNHLYNEENLNDLYIKGKTLRNRRKRARRSAFRHRKNITLDTIFFGNYLKSDSIFFQNYVIFVLNSLKNHGLDPNDLSTSLSNLNINLSSEELGLVHENSSFCGYSQELVSLVFNSSFLPPEEKLMIDSLEQKILKLDKKNSYPQIFYKKLAPVLNSFFEKNNNFESIDLFLSKYGTRITKTENLEPKPIDSSISQQSHDSKQTDLSDTSHISLLFDTSFIKFDTNLFTPSFKSSKLNLNSVFHFGHFILSIFYNLNSSFYDQIISLDLNNLIIFNRFLKHLIYSIHFIFNSSFYFSDFYVHSLIKPYIARCHSLQIISSLFFDNNQKNKFSFFLNFHNINYKSFLKQINILQKKRNLFFNNIYNDDLFSNTMVNQKLYLLQFPFFDISYGFIYDQLTSNYLDLSELIISNDLYSDSLFDIKKFSFIRRFQLLKPYLSLNHYTFNSFVSLISTYFYFYENPSSSFTVSLFDPGSHLSVKHSFKRKSFLNDRLFFFMDIYSYLNKNDQTVYESINTTDKYLKKKNNSFQSKSKNKSLIDTERLKSKKFKIKYSEEPTFTSSLYQNTNNIEDVSHENKSLDILNYKPFFLNYSLIFSSTRLFSNVLFSSSNYSFFNRYFVTHMHLVSSKLDMSHLSNIMLYSSYHYFFTYKCINLFLSNCYQNIFNFYNYSNFFFFNVVYYYFFIFLFMFFFQIYFSFYIRFMFLSIIKIIYNSFINSFKFVFFNSLFLSSDSIFNEFDLFGFNSSSETIIRYYYLLQSCFMYSNSNVSFLNLSSYFHTNSSFINIKSFVHYSFYFYPYDHWLFNKFSSFFLRSGRRSLSDSILLKLFSFLKRSIPLHPLYVFSYIINMLRIPLVSIFIKKHRRTVNLVQPVTCNRQLFNAFKLIQSSMDCNFYNSYTFFASILHCMFQKGFIYDQYCNYLNDMFSQKHLLSQFEKPELKIDITSSQRLFTKEDSYSFGSAGIRYNTVREEAFHELD